MRFDALGMFWEDRPQVRGQPRQLGPMPPIPETGWTPPDSFPNLDSAKVIALDTETKDPELRTAGPGWARGSGHLIGVSLAVPGRSWYFPMRHETQTELNMDPEKVLAYLRYTLAGEQPKIGANIIYDIGWLAEEGVEVGGPKFDIQFAEALLNSEAPDVSLESLANKYLGIGKVTSDLYVWLADWCGGPATDTQRKNLFRAPVTLAGPYAEADAELPLQILEAQWPLLEARGVLDLFSMECRLIPLLVKMRQKGVPVNLSRAEEARDRFSMDMDRIAASLREMTGRDVNVNSRDSLQKAFASVGLTAPVSVNSKTKERKESYAAPVLETIEHPLPQAILEYRKLAKVRDTFIQSYILDKHVNGRVYCNFHPLKSDGSGTRSGRFASSQPNLQNIPIRTEIGAMIRDLFETTGEGGRWRTFDYSQIEYRLLAHHAVGGGADELRSRFINDPDTDYHELVHELIKKLTGLDLKRRDVKTVNFGLLYGMSQRELQNRLHIQGSVASNFFESYHKAAPFVRATMDDCVREAHRDGYITTILGRKSDFPLWAPVDAFGLPGFEYGEAILKYGPNISRAFTHKALNRKLQGGAADVMKAAMVMAYESGLFDEDACGIPLLTVHDELDFEDYGDPEAAHWEELKQTMETCVPLRIPLKVDAGVGKTWRSAD